MRRRLRLAFVDNSRRASVICYTARMDTQQPGDASVANDTASAAQASQEFNSASFIGDELPVAPTADASRASPVTALADALEFNLTVPQARQLFEQHSRNVPAQRTMQNWCDLGKIAAKRITHTDRGRPVTEWLINDKSLLDFIRRQPVIKIHAATSSDARDANGDASAAHAAQEDVASFHPTGTPTEARAASDASAAGDAIGERRTIAEMLIENARLLEIVTANSRVIHEKEAAITDLKNDREWLREEVRENRTLRQDIKEISRDMLQTFATVAIESGRARSERSQSDLPTARIIETDREVQRS